MMTKKTAAETIHEGNMAEENLESQLDDLLEQQHPEIPGIIGYSLGFDWYDNSIEIYFDDPIPYPWEPCAEAREFVKSHGFSIVYWNFRAENDGPFVEEIRGNEPRRFKNVRTFKDSSGVICNRHTHYPGIGFVDDRFNLDEWMERYGNSLGVKLDPSKKPFVHPEA